MTTCIGFLMLFGIIIGGIYLYQKVERLNQEITKQHQSALTDTEDDSV